MYWSPNFLAVVKFSKSKKFHSNKHSSRKNAGFSIRVFKNFPGVIPLDPHSGNGRLPPAPNTQPGLWQASAPLLGPKPRSPSTFQPWLRPSSLLLIFCKCRFCDAALLSDVLGKDETTSYDNTDGRYTPTAAARRRRCCFFRSLFVHRGNKLPLLLRYDDHPPSG